jgi:hypothetical protein
MSGTLSRCMGVAVVGTVLLAGAVATNAAGALAVGSCTAYGYAYDFREDQSARAAALQKCSGQCKIVATMRHGCAAYAVDSHKKCGAHGYASAPTLGRAQNVALRFCYKYGGRDCMVRAWACDGSG